MKSPESIKNKVEISGFGDGYEKTCQEMLQNGYEWLKSHNTSSNRT